jgi:hypothetical protein
MYNLLQTQIIDSALTEAQINTLINAHKTQFLAEEDGEFPKNIVAGNDFIFKNMEPAPEYAAELTKLLKTKYLTKIDSTQPDNVEYYGCVVRRVNSHSQQLPRKTFAKFIDLSLQICLQHDGPRPTYILNSPQDIAANSPSTPYDPVKGQGLLWVSSKYASYLPQIPLTPLDNKTLRNVYVTYQWKMEVPTNTDLQS